MTARLVFGDPVVIGAPAVEAPCLEELVDGFLLTTATLEAYTGDGPGGDEIPESTTNTDDEFIRSAGDLVYSDDSDADADEAPVAWGVFSFPTESDSAGDIVTTAPRTGTRHIRLFGTTATNAYELYVTTLKLCTPGESPTQSGRQHTYMTGRVEENDTIDVEVWGRSEHADANQTGQVHVIWFESDYTEISISSGTSQSYNTTYTQMTASVTAPADAYYFLVVVRIDNVRGGNPGFDSGDAYLDDLDVERTP